MLREGGRLLVHVTRITDAENIVAFNGIKVEGVKR